MRLLIVLLLAFCLPLQSMSAVTMPFCQSGDVPPADQLGMYHSVPMAHTGTMDHHGVHNPERVPQDQDDSAHHGLNCNECGLCHLACAPALPSALSVPPEKLQSVFYPSALAQGAAATDYPVFKPPLGSVR